jgi:magnesium-transporting ATPase (P-type)
LCGALCTETPEIHDAHNTSKQVDPTELAVINASVTAGITKHEINDWKYLDIVPFQTEKRMMAVLLEKGREKVVYVKGSPEKIFALCGIDKDEALLQKVEQFGREGLRVIACAKKSTHSGTTVHEESLHSGFSFLGLFALIDPPREDVKESIAACKKSGIRVVMITGDHPVTASAIAEQLGIADTEVKAITGQELAQISDAELIDVIRSATVFARVTPDQKLRIVNAYKEAGEIVAVTGDGVNDAPALKSAHIGIAMGKRGTDVAKEASDMVILDDDFSTIVKSVKEARVLFENIRKATFFLIPTGFSVILTVIVSIFLGYPMPFTAVQLLWVNLVTNGLQDVSLAFEPEEHGVLNKPPRKPTEGIMSPMLYRRSILVAVVITIGVMIMYSRAVNSGYSLEHTRTIALSTMIIFQFLQLFNARSETASIFRMKLFNNRFLLLSMSFALIAFILSITWPPLQWVLSTTTLKTMTVFQMILMACTVVVVVEIDKAFLSHRRSS